ncbi:MAG TPA: response regulator [Polyangiaceae bacterium]|nr:response regulator [Polyangiaceae bacterium]
MVEQAGAPPGEAETSLADSRAQFVASLARRLEALRQALFALEQAPRSAPLRDHLRRRIHAFGAAAGVLGFDRVFDAFREAEAVLGRTSAAVLGPAELGLVGRTLDLVPSLVLGAAAPVARARDAQGAAGIDRRGGGFPTSVLVFGPAALAEPLERGQGVDTAGLELERAEESDRAEAIVRITAPDVAVVDADLTGARELMETLVYDPLLDPVRIVAVGSFDRPEAAASLVALGVARVLPKPVSPDTLRRSVLEVARERAAPAERIDAIGEVTVEALGERIAHEIRRGLVDAVKAQSRATQVPLGAGTDVLAAVWSAVARIRELVTLRSGGFVRFDASGPEGAVPLAPWMGDERSRGPSSAGGRSAEGVSLEGRTIIVVDDDPAVVWFISGLLRSGGAEVIEAHDGAYALDVARKASPDVIVSDILMPTLDGFALCREIKRDVALSDVPVILLSWKEDLLQRVRELGADAQGYLRKEATASTVVQRVREVLLPRARIEARLSEGGAARGRLDGVTPRLVLSLVCKKSVDARLTVRDAAYLYEVDVRGGRVRTATRTSADGRFDRGERALSALLGVRAGRFTVTRDDSPCVQIWDTPLDELIAEPVERARAAQRALSNPARVAQVEIEEGVLEPYLSATPVSAAAIVRRLAEGVPPSDIVAAGASPRLLESVLVDLVLHGAITRIVGFDGEDLLAVALAELEASRANVHLEAARDFRTPGPPVALAAKEPPAGDGSANAEPSEAFAEVERAKGGDAIGGFDDWEIGGAAPGSQKAQGPDELFAILGDSVVPPADGVEERPESGRVSQKGAAPPTSLPAEPSPLETALRSLPASVSSQFWKAQQEPRIEEAVPAEAAREEPPQKEAAGEGPPQKDAAREESPAPEGASPITLPAGVERDSSEAFVAAASEPPAPAAAAVVEEKEPAESTTDVDGSAPQPAGQKEAAAAAGTKTAVSPVAALPSAEQSGAPPVAEPELSPPPVNVSAPSNAIAEVIAVVSASETAAAEAPEVRRLTPPDGTPVAAEPSASAGTARAGESSRTPAPELELGEAVASAVGGAPKTQPSTATPRAIPSKGVRTTPPVGARSLAGRGASHRSPAVPPRKAAPEATNILVVVAVMAVAAFASFKIITVLRNGFAGAPAPVAASSANVAPTESAPVTTADPTSPAPSSSAVPASGGRLALTSKDLDLPAGLAVSEDRGLLEVNVDPAESVYVDGVFIGKGPMRQVPLREGAHEIRIQAEGVDVAQPIEVRRARRTHIEVARVP